jgi:hypothetical protein
MVIEDTRVQDPATGALDHLVRMANSSAHALSDVEDDLGTMQDQRRRGWSWRRIVTTPDALKPIGRMTEIAAQLAAAGGTFRRALTKALRKEGMPVSDIGDAFGVSRQRISALLRPDEPDAR